MAAKVRTPAGKALYARRKVIVEPVFGQIKEVRGFRRFLLRGLEKIRGEWRLVCLREHGDADGGGHEPPQNRKTSGRWPWGFPSIAFRCDSEMGR